MSYLAFNLLLAIIWMLLIGDYATSDLLVGFIVGFVAISLSRPVIGSQRYVRSVLGVVRLALSFTKELVMANLHLAREILRPKLRFEPGFLACDVGDLDPTQTVMLANLVSLTPGTLSVDVDDEGQTLYVHTLYAGDAARVRAELRSMADLIHAASGDPPARNRGGDGWK